MYALNARGAVTVLRLVCITLLNPLLDPRGELLFSPFKGKETEAQKV